MYNYISVLLGYSKIISYTTTDIGLYQNVSDNIVDALGLRKRHNFRNLTYSGNPCNVQCQNHQNHSNFLVGNMFLSPPPQRKKRLLFGRTYSS